MLVVTYLLAMEESPVRFRLRAPKFDVGNSSNGRTTVSEAVNWGSIPWFPANALEAFVVMYKTSNLDKRVRLSPSAPKFNVGDSSNGRTAVFEAAN